MIEFYHQKEIDMLKLGCTLPNLANICLHKSTDSNFKFLPFYRKRQRLFGEDSWRYGWLSLHCLYTQSCGWRDFYPQFKECVQINCRHRRKPNLSLFNVSTNAYWIVYKMELWHWISKVHASTDQNTLLRKYGPFHIFNKLVQSVRLKARLQQVDKRRLIALVLMEFFLPL